MSFLELGLWASHKSVMSYLSVNDPYLLLSTSVSQILFSFRTFSNTRIDGQVNANID